MSPGEELLMGRGSTSVFGATSLVLALKVPCLGKALKWKVPCPRATPLSHSQTNQDRVEGRVGGWEAKGLDGGKMR